MTRYLEIRNTSVWVLHNIWRLGRVRSSNLARKALIKCYWMLRNTRVTAFTGFWVIKGKLTEGIKLPQLFSVVVSLNSWVVIYLPWMNIFFNFYVIVSFWSYILLLETSASTTTLDSFKSTRTETSYLSTLLFSNCFKLFGTLFSSSKSNLSTVVFKLTKAFLGDSDVSTTIFIYFFIFIFILFLYKYIF